MGFLDRIHDIVTATGSALQSPVGFVKDVAVAFPELAQGDATGFTGDVYHAFTGRLGQAVGSTIGPQGVGGELAGAIPEPLREPTAGLIDRSQNEMDAAYHDLIGKPISTAVTAGSLASRPGHDISDLGNTDTWAQAYNIAEHRSPGQSIALAFMTKDILNPDQVKKAQGSDFYGAMSGTSDAVFRTVLDPTAIALGGSTEYLKGLHGVDSQAAIDFAQRTGRISHFADAVGAISAEHGDGAAAVIRHTYFPKHEYGAWISDILANADKIPLGLAESGAPENLVGAPARERVIRILMGKTDELEAIRDLRPDLAGQLDRLTQQRLMVRGMSLNGTALADDGDALANLDKEVNALTSQQARLQRLDDLATTIKTIPKDSSVARLRSRLTLGDWYQTSPLAKPLHQVFDMEPHPWVHLDDPGSDQSLWRMLQKSELPVDQQLVWRSRYQAATSPIARMNLLNAAEDAAVGSVATKAGMSPDELQSVLAEASRGRSMTKQALDSRAYDGEGRSVITYEDDAGQLIHHHVAEAPLYETQLPNLAPIVDMDKVREAVQPISQFKNRMLDTTPGARAGQEVLDDFARLWKPAVLLRIGFPVRFLGDEALRSVAKIGVLSTMKNIGEGLHDVGTAAKDGVYKALNIDNSLSHTDIADKVADWTGEPASILRDTARQAEADGVSKADLVEHLAQEHNLGSMTNVLLSPVRRARGMDPTLINGHMLEGAFSAPGDGAQIYKSLIQAKESFGTLISQNEGKYLDQLIQSGPWRSVDPTETAYPQAWEHAVNKQIGQSSLGRQLLERMQGPTATDAAAGAERSTPDQIVSDVTDWLNNTDEGKALKAQLPFRKDLNQWVQAAHDQVDSYLPTDELKAAAWNGNATHDMLTESLPNASNRPVVHGGVIDESLGLSEKAKAYRGFVDAAMNNLAAKPSNVLMRNPFFDHMYQAEITRQMGLLTGERQIPLSERIARRVMGVGESQSTGFNIDQATLDQMQTRARRYAMNETKNLFHNFAEEPNLAKTLGFLSPFYTAYSQVAGRWAGLAIENPAFVRRLQIMWRSPERAGLVTDGKGNVIDEHGKIITPVMDSQYKVGDPAADGQRNVTMHMPKWAIDHVPGVSRVGDLKFGKDSANLLLHGSPPVGPIVQLAANEVAKDRPDLEASLKWALPFGAVADTKSILLPTLAKRIEAQSEGDANRSYAYTKMRIWTDRMIDYNLGKTQQPPTWEQVSKDADAFWHMRTLAGFTLPVTPQFTSPYQHYIDAFRARQDLDAHMTPQQKQAPDYQTPDEWFHATFGDEFFPIVAAMSKSMDGVAPTLEGAQLHKQYADLYAKYPELGSLISGEQGAGTFSNGVYQQQFNKSIGPGNTDKEREVRNYKDFETEASTKLGWMEFSRVMDQLDSVLAQRGLSSFSVKGAADLAAMKKNTIQFLANDPKYAGWYEDYAATDSSKWDRRIAGMTAIVADPRMQARPEFAGLREYLSGRADMTNTLTSLGKSQLHSQATAGLLRGWDYYVQNLVSTNPAFGALYHRYLENDPVTVTPITMAAQTGALPA